ncbi:DUF3592 domain-containing protein [Marinobacter halodurans]|uniref:DUF3592 domain-containing protein n=1 Tax=Marinobacter halodurans TaxID=2528979 RepID=A0ABY1ZR54_9GAMM|nr:DUF3592 domain-containing protein [Marinobacter halodurans]TBW59616.1 DUF3592 domain-containing protein [Marinobacter halodurans]
MDVSQGGSTARHERSANKARWGVNLFGLVFLVAGLGVLVFSPLATLYEHVGSAGWVRVQATLNQIELHSHRGDDSTTWSVDATYTYRIGGHTYTGHRVGYDIGSDNIGDYQRQLVSRMRRISAQGPVAIWVNPDDPAESYLVRELRWKKLLFGGLFGVVFAVAGVAVLLLGRRRRRLAADPTEIFSSQRYGHWVFGFMAFMFLAISLPGVLAVPDEFADGNWLVLLVLLFPLAGLWLARLAWVSRRNWRYYGPMPLRPDPAPGQVGGDVGGQIRLSRPEIDAPWQVTLQCVRVSIRSGKNSSRSERIIWQDRQVPYVHTEGPGAVVAFRFTPPAELPPSDDSGREQVLWRLVLDGPREPVALERTYELPVEPGTRSSAVTLPREHVERTERKAQVAATSAAAEQIDVEPWMDGWRIHSRAGRNLGFTLAVLIGGLFFAGAAVGLGIAAASEGFMLYMMAAFFGLFGFPMVLGGLFMLGRSLDVRIRQQQVRSVRAWCGMALWRRQGTLTRAGQLVLTSAGSANKGHRMTEYFHLEMNAAGKRIRIAEGLAGREVAEALRDNLVRLLRLP